VGCPDSMRRSYQHSISSCSASEKLDLEQRRPPDAGECSGLRPCLAHVRGSAWHWHSRCSPERRIAGYRKGDLRKGLWVHVRCGFASVPCPGHGICHSSVTVRVSPTAVQEHFLMKISWLALGLLTSACSGSPAPLADAGSSSVGGTSPLGAGGAAGGGGAKGGTMALAGSAATGGSGHNATTAVRACKDTGSTPSNTSCRSVADCGPVGPIKCCTTGNCWPASACPLPPTTCSQHSSNTLECSLDADCGEGGTCIKGVSGCPQCPYSICQRPPPRCTQSPDDCGTDARCQPDGSCAPLPCNAGYTCPAGRRCSVGSTRSDGHGCELIPCNDGWTCSENSRCTAPDDASTHGCTALTCSNDTECDCGYCVNNTCTANLGTCTPAPA